MKGSPWSPFAPRKDALFPMLFQCSSRSERRRRTAAHGRLSLRERMLVSSYAVSMQPFAERKATMNGRPWSPFAPRKDAPVFLCCSNALFRGAKGDNERQPIVLSLRERVFFYSQNGRLLAGPSLARRSAPFVCFSHSLDLLLGASSMSNNIARELTSIIIPCLEPARVYTAMPGFAQGTHAAGVGADRHR